MKAASQIAKYLRKPWNTFPEKFNATANELGQSKTQLSCHKDILLTTCCHKICQTKRWNKKMTSNSAKDQIKIQNRIKTQNSQIKL